MRICHVQFGRYPGQGNTAIMQSTRLLAEAGHDMSVVVAGGREKPSHEVVDGVAVHRLPFERLSFARLNNVRFMLSASRELRELGDLDIVHVYSSLGACIPPLISGVDAKWVLDIRSGVTAGGIKTRVGNRLKRLDARFFDRVLVIDELLGERLLPGGTYDVMPLGVATSVFHHREGARERVRRELDLQESTVLVYVGKMGPLRNLDTLLSAFASAKEMREERLKLLMVGTGEEVPRLKDLAEELGVSRDVVFTGYVDHEEVPDYLSAADVGVAYVPVNPVYDVQPPTKTLEYLACGLPVVATDTRGNRRFVREGENGVVVGDSSEDFAAGIAGALDTGDAVDTRVAEDQSWRTITEKRLLPIYESLVTGERP